GLTVSHHIKCAVPATAYSMESWNVMSLRSASVPVLIHAKHMPFSRTIKTGDKQRHTQSLVVESFSEFVSSPHGNDLHSTRIEPLDGPATRCKVRCLSDGLALVSIAFIDCIHYEFQGKPSSSFQLSLHTAPP